MKLTFKMKIPLSLKKWPRLSGVEETKPDIRLINELKLIVKLKNTTNIITIFFQIVADLFT